MKRLAFILAGMAFTLHADAQCSVDSVPQVGTGNTYIDMVEVDNITISGGSGVQSSGNSYQAFSSPYIHLTQGASAQFFIVGFSAQPYNQCVWIDFNADSIYTSSELVCYTQNSLSGSQTYSVNVPYDAMADTLSMRVMKLTGQPGWGGGNDAACFASFDGEVEDYEVIVACGNFNFVNFDPNPEMCYADSVYLSAFTMYGDIAWYTEFNGSPVGFGSLFTMHFAGYVSDTTVYVQNTAGGCFNAPLMAMQLILDPAPVVNILGPDTVQSCTAMTFDAGPSIGNYFWSNGDQTQTTTITSGYGGNLNVQVTNSFGCSTSDHIWVSIAPNAPATYASVQPSSSFCSNYAINLVYDSIIDPGTCTWYTYPGNVLVGTGSNLAYILPDTGVFQFIGYINSVCGLDTAIVSIYAGENATYDSIYTPQGTLGANGIYSICYSSSLIDVVIANLNGTVDHWEIGDTSNFCCPMNIYDDDTLSLPSALMQTGVVYFAYAITMSPQGCPDTTEIWLGTPANTISFSFPDTSWRCSFPVVYGIGAVDYGVYDILWNTGDTTNTINVTAPGYFTILTVDNSSGCSISEHVYIGDGTMPGDPLHDTTVVCDNFAYFDINPAGYNAFDWWEYDNQWQLINNNSSYDYTVTDNGFDQYLAVDCQNAHGCMLRDTTFIDFGGTFTFSLGPDVTTTANPYTLTGPPGYMYYWSPGGQTTQSIQVTMTGTYSLTVYNGQNCSYTDVIAVTIDPMNVNASANNNAINVFPNPAEDHVSISSASAITIVNVYDAEGRLVKSQNAENSATVEIETADLANGLYTIEVETAEGLSREKLVISR